MASVFVGHDWAEDHHDLYVENAEGRRLDRKRIEDGLAGVAAFHAMIAEHTDTPDEVLIASETDRGLFVTALLAAGYSVIAINPKSTSRYRERLSTSGAKSDQGDARTLAEVARLDGHNIDAWSPTARSPTPSRSLLAPIRT
jgi:transposase